MNTKIYCIVILTCLGLSRVAHSIGSVEINFTNYHDLEEINSYLRKVASNYPSLAKLKTLGYSEEGREILMLVLSRFESRGLPGIYVNGTHHGNERSSPEAVLGICRYLIESRNIEFVKSLLESYAVYLHPVVNPDGFARGTRLALAGIDPNRDYGYPNREGRVFRLRETRLVRDFLETTQVRASIAIHSGMEGVLWPNGFTKDANKHHNVFMELAKRSAMAMQMDSFKQSFFDYPTEGEFIDFAYHEFGVMALTFEISNEPTPESFALSGVVDRAVSGVMAFMLGVSEIDRGIWEFPVELQNSFAFVQ